jgi:GR25 family glycosyltransferase involved in LPS biosynthesis
MNLSKPLRAASRFLHYLFLRCRKHLPRKQCFAFGPSTNPGQLGIGQIYIINLDRQPERWADIVRELACIMDAAGKPLTDRATRYSASDARTDTQDAPDIGDIDPFYTLGDQLYVEPQPLALPDEFDLVRPIRMSQAEVAIARSHIGVWRAIADSTAPYALVIEDDVWFEKGFARILDQAWREMKDADGADPAFDMLYVSYAEARRGAPKELVSENVFRPERGLWFLSGYVLSRNGARALLRLLPCRGPIDLWINHKFCAIDVRALRRPVVNQRADLLSTNSYSILPALSRIGALDYSSAALFLQRPTHYPVFAFGAPGSGLSSLATALSMLGYRCCSDLDRIPEREFEKLITGSGQPIFNAYVNVASLKPHLRTLMRRYPYAKFVLTDDEDAVDRCSVEVLEAIKDADVVRLRKDANTWRTLCEHLRLPPPAAPYPVVRDIGRRRHQGAPAAPADTATITRLRYDRSPWVAEPHAGWEGISASVSDRPRPPASRVTFEDNLTNVQAPRWLLRNDTFPGNLGRLREIGRRSLARCPSGVAWGSEPQCRCDLKSRQFSVRAIRSYAASNECSGSSDWLLPLQGFTPAGDRY